MARVLYRVIRGETPTLDDFTSHRALGKACRDRSMVREWAEGVSVYSRLDYAADRVRATRFQIGAFVVPIEVPDDGSIEFRQTGRDPNHFTVYGEPEQLVRLVAGPVIAVEGS